MPALWRRAGVVETKLKRSAASRLRGLADRLEPPRLPVRPPAPLIRLAGRWWRRDELIAEATADDPAGR
jgi:hypothetical protein